MCTAYFTRTVGVVLVCRRFEYRHFGVAFLNLSPFWLVAVLTIDRLYLGTIIIESGVPGVLIV